MRGNNETGSGSSTVGLRMVTTMGFGIELKCPKCSFQQVFPLGTEYGYPRVYEEVTGKIRKRAYGKELKMFFA